MCIPDIDSVSFVDDVNPKVVHSFRSLVMPSKWMPRNVDGERRSGDSVPNVIFDSGSNVWCSVNDDSFVISVGEQSVK